MPSLSAAVDKVQAQPGPVVFLDTCVLLDIVRAPHRNLASAVQAALEMVAGAQKTPPTLYPVIGCPTPTEWNDHIVEAVTDCSNAVNSVDAVAEAWSFLGMDGIPCLPDPAKVLPGRLKDLSETLLNSAILLDKDADSLSRAIDRVIMAELPAKKGGKGVKDAVILEHAISLTKALRDAGFGLKCIFASSNTEDFATSKTSRLHPKLEPLFAAANLDYAASLTAAVALLKAAGWMP